MMEFFSNNEFATGGLLMVLAGAILAYIRGVPTQIWYLFLKNFTVFVEIANNEGHLFFAADKWLDDMFSAKSTKLKCVSSYDDKYIFSLAEGFHWFFWNKKLVWVTRTISKESLFSNARETILIRVFSRKQKWLREIIDDGKRLAEKERKGDNIKIFYKIGDWWKNTNTLEGPIAKPILSEQKYENIMKSVSSFSNAKQKYKNLGMRYKRNFMLYGEPGNGKTSMVLSLAYETNRNIYALNLSDKSLKDSDLVRLITDIPKDSILLLEDIDCVSISHERNKEYDDKTNKGKDKEEDTAGISLNGLLNVLDGALFKEGLIIFSTTNYLEKLDSALVRPGRIDEKIYIGNSTEKQCEEIYRRFYPSANGEAVDFAKEWVGKPMAELEQKLASETILAS